jgi:hypothetical protein
VLRSQDRRVRHARLVAVYVAWQLLLGPLSGHAQDVQDPTWGQPVNVSNSPAQSGLPSLAVDPSGRVHVIWSERTADDESWLWYVHGQRGSWSEANDVLLTPGGETATAPVLAADRQGNLHVAWLGGASVYYSRAYAPGAGSAQAWWRPQHLVTSQNYIGPPDLDVALSGEMFLAYSVQIGPESGVYFLQSTDGGTRWSDRQPIYRNDLSARMVDKARLAAGTDGLLHVVWVESAQLETGPPPDIWYAVSADGGTTWSAPVSLGQGPYNYPEITVRGANEVHVVWSGTTTDRYKFHSWSADNGVSWSPAWRNEALGGFQGLPALVVDGSGGLHWVQVGSVFGEIVEGVDRDQLFEQEWLGNEWSQARAILNTKPVGNNMSHVSSMAALGNELYVALQVPLGTSDSYQMDILVLHRTLAASSIPAQQLAPPTAMPSITPEVVRTATAEVAQVTPAPSLALVVGGTQRSAASDPWRPLTRGVVAATAVCALTLCAVLLRRTRR